MRETSLLEIDLSLFGESGTAPGTEGTHAPPGTQPVAPAPGESGRMTSHFRAQTPHRSHAEAGARQLLTRLWEQNPQVQAEYPGFDLRAELKDRGFFRLVRSGVPVRQAYELSHMEEIKAKAARNAAQQMAARMRARSARPAENGTSSRSAVTVKSDVSKLTSAERAEIARRVARGETIAF